MEITRSSFSQYSAFLACPRKFYLGYVLNLTPIEQPDYFSTGIQFHEGASGIEGLSTWHKIGMLARNHFPRRPNEQSEVRKVIKIGGQEVTVIADGLCDDGIIEWKTTGRANEMTVEAQALSNQLQLYAHAFDKKKIILRLVKKPAIRQKQSENEDMFQQRFLQEFVDKPNEYFLEIEVPVDTSKAVDEFIQVNSLINSCKTRGIWPCAAPYGCYSLTPCTFLKYCSDPATNAVLYKTKEVKHV